MNKKKKFCSEVNSAVHGHKWRNLPLVYFNQRNNNNNNNKFHGEIEKSRLQSIPYLLIFFVISFSCRMTLVYDASSKRDYDSADGKDLFRSTNVSHFLQRSCESERKSRSFPAKKLRGRKKGRL